MLKTIVDLFPHQQVGVNKAIENNGLLLALMRAGTGATTVGLAAVDALLEGGMGKKALVINRAATLQYTLKQIEEMFPGRQVLDVKRTGFTTTSRFDIGVISIGLFQKYADDIITIMNPDIVMVDDIFNIALPVSKKAYEALYKIRHRLDKFIGVSTQINKMPTLTHEDDRNEKWHDLQIVLSLVLGRQLTEEDYQKYIFNVDILEG